MAFFKITRNYFFSLEMRYFAFFEKFEPWKFLLHIHTNPMCNMTVLMLKFNILSELTKNVNIWHLPALTQNVKFNAFYIFQNWHHECEKFSNLTSWMRKFQNLTSWVLKFSNFRIHDAKISKFDIRKLIIQHL